MARRDPLTAAEAALRDFALTFPQSTEDFPWGERALKVKGKVFLFLSRHDGNLSFCVKLPVSNSSALELPFAEPTGYGLGKHCWVSAMFTPGDAVPIDLLREWIDESYRAVAPKSVLAKFEQGADAPPARPNPKPRKRAK